ncbi:MAG: hypothetical protein QXU46_04950 [Candidatus Bathyarchaeia archaeon]
MKTGKAFMANSSGQLLIVASLVIAILITSTSIYVYELTTEIQTMKNCSTLELALALNTGLRNAVVSALANITNGGRKNVLAENLALLVDTYMQLHPQQPCQIAYTLPSVAGYDDGIKLSWGSSGLGVSSAYVLYTLKILEPASNLTIHSALNITTTLVINGYYTIGENETIKTVSLTCKVFNEDKPAKVKQVNVYWGQAPEVWLPIRSLSIVDCGNGTYVISFTITTASEAVYVSAQMVDARNIFVAANTTCSQA